MDVAAAPVSCRPWLKSLATKHVKQLEKPRASRSTPLASLAICGQRLQRRPKAASCAQAQTDAEAVQLWQEAFALELERAERLGTSAAEAPSDSAPASEWQAAYESLKAANLQLEMEAVKRRREELKRDEDEPPAPKKEIAKPKSRERSEDTKPLVLSLLDLPMIDIDSKQLADVARFRDALGPGTLPLLAALFEEKGELPEPAEVREALKLPGSGFTATGNLNVGRCVVVRGLLALDVGGRGTPRSFVEERQASLDESYGEGQLVVLLQRERPPPAPSFRLWPKGDFDPADVNAAQKEYPAALLVFLASDLPMEESSSIARRLGIGVSFAATAAFCNIIPAAVRSLNGVYSDALLNKSVVDVTYSEMLGVAVTRLDPNGALPIPLGLVAMLFFQDLARRKAAEQNDAKMRGGYFIPSSSLGTLGRTWSIAGLSPSRKTDIEVALFGSFAGFFVAASLCLAGLLHGDASDGLLLVDVNRLPLLLAQALGDAFPEDAAQRVLTLSTEAPGEAPGGAPQVATQVTLDPLLLSGSLAMTAQATQLLPLRGFDGHILARFLFGPRLVQLAELSTAVVLLLGAAERLGPNANAAVCSSALFAWAAAFLASREAPLPPREDFDDEAIASPGTAAAAVAALAASGLILIPGKLIPYGLQAL